MPPQLSISWRGAELCPRELYIPPPPPPASVCRESVPTCRVGRNGALGLLGPGREAKERRRAGGRPHGNTHIHMQEGVSTRRNVSRTRGETSSPGERGGARISSLPPPGRESVSVVCEGQAHPENVLHLTYARGGGNKHAWLGQRGVGQGAGVGVGGGTVISSLLPRHHPAVSVRWPRVTGPRTRHFQGLHGVGEGRRWEKAGGNGILGYKSPQKLFEGANMCPGRQKKNLTLHMAKRTPS